MRKSIYRTSLDLWRNRIDETIQVIKWSPKWPNVEILRTDIKTFYWDCVLSDFESDPHAFKKHNFLRNLRSSHWIIYGKNSKLNWVKTISRLFAESQPPELLLLECVVILGFYFWYLSLGYCKSQFKQMSCQYMLLMFSGEVSKYNISPR